MRLFLLLFLFFVYLLSCSALSIVVSGAEPGERWAPAVRDESVCGKGVVLILGLDAEVMVDTGLLTQPDDVIDVKVSDERPPLSSILDQLYWQTVITIPDDDDDLGAAGVYGPLHPNVGSTRCLVEGRDA